MIESLINTRERIDNTLATPTSDKHYYPTWVIMPDGETLRPALFTGEALSEAIKRGEKYIAIMPPRYVPQPVKPWYIRLWDGIVGND